MRTPRPFSRLLVSSGLLLLLLMALPGCDSGGSNDTLVLNDPATPTETSFEFRYTEDDFSDGVISVVSEESDELAEVFEGYPGFGRGDVVSVRVEEVWMERRSLAGTSAKQAAKVFDYLSRAEIYFGTTTDAPLIGERDNLDASSAEVELDLGPDRDVTEQVKSGPTRARLVLSIDDPAQVPGNDGIEVDVRFRIEVQE